METISRLADILQNPVGENGEDNTIYFLKLNENLDCSRFRMDKLLFFLVVMAWTLILLSYFVLNCTMRRNTMILQRILMIIPILKLIHCGAYYLFLTQCPWITKSTEFTTKYLIMALVTISSIYQSIIIGIVMILSTGWSLLHFHMSREYATRVTVFMGLIYLSYSAYYVSLPNSIFRIFMELFIILSYSYIFVISMKFIIKVTFILRRFFTYMEDNNIQYLIDATRLKYKMISRFKYIHVLFFLNQVIFQGIMPLVLEFYNKDLYFTTSIDLSEQIFEIIIYASFLFNFRSREWPQHFHIASFELGNLNHLLEDENERNIPEVYKTRITQSFLDASFRSCKQEYENLIVVDSMNDGSENSENDMNVLLLNPSYEDSEDIYSHLIIGKKVQLKSVHSDSSDL